MLDCLIRPNRLLLLLLLLLLLNKEIRKEGRKRRSLKAMMKSREV
jgi:hypothetical protein